MGFYQVNPYQYARTTSRAIPCFNEDGTYFSIPLKQNTKMMSYNVLNELDNTGNRIIKKFGDHLRYTIMSGLNFETLLGFWHIVVRRENHTLQT
ncbi:MAG: hypothetical protein ACLU4J_10165 [Butyricimonas paravirosa]